MADPHVDYRVVVVSSILEETPEGVFHMDRLRRDYEEHLLQLEPWQRKILEGVESEVDRLMLGLR